jgi:hypothetical protein
MRDFDPPERYQIDPHETFETFLEREFQEIFKRGISAGYSIGEVQQAAYKEWEQQEAKKDEYQKQLQREEEDHKRTVEKLKIRASSRARAPRSDTCFPV